MDKLSYIRQKMKKSLSESPNSSYKSPDAPIPDKIGLLNKDGTGLSDEVEDLLRRRLLRGETNATASIYEAYGLERDKSGVWARPIVRAPVSQTNESEPEPYDETDLPVGDLRDLKLRYMRSGRFGKR